MSRNPEISFDSLPLSYLAIPAIGTMALSRGVRFYDWVGDGEIVSTNGYEYLNFKDVGLILSLRRATGSRVTATIDPPDKVVLHLNATDQSQHHKASDFLHKEGFTRVRK